jgi:hypothetical protein
LDAVDTNTHDREPPAHLYAAADVRPVSQREQELCETASHTDWLYLGGLFVLDLGSIYVDSHKFRFADSPSVRLMGPSLMGLSWGWTLGGLYLAVPKCRPGFITYGMPEGDIRLRWPAAISIALLSAASAPFLARIEQGPVRDQDWDLNERAGTVILPVLTGFAGALIPYLLPPRTYSAARQLERIRLGLDASAKGSLGTGYLNYEFRF